MRKTLRILLAAALLTAVAVSGISSSAYALGGPYSDCFSGTVCIAPNGIWTYNFGNSENYPSVTGCTYYGCGYNNVNSMRNRMSGSQRRFMAINVAFFTGTCRELPYYSSIYWVAVSFSANQLSVSPTHYSFCNYVV